MLEIVARDGYKAVTVRALTKLAHVSTATFYAQFDGTEDCLLDTYSMLLGRITDRVRASRSPGLGRTEQLGRSLLILVRELADPLTGRFALIEVFDAGPAGLARIDHQERGLATDVAGCLSRRGTRVSPTVGSWILAGVMRAVRVRILAGEPFDPQLLAESLASWGASLLAEERLDTSREAPPFAGTPSIPSVNQTGDDRAILLSALVRCAKSEGYWRLSAASVCRAAGLSVTKFKRQFANVDDCFQAAIRVLATTYLKLILKDDQPALPSLAEMTRGTEALRTAVMADPDLARLAFAEVLDSGASGLLGREELISDLTVAWQGNHPMALDALVAEASIAALWAGLAGSLRAGTSQPARIEWETIARLLSAPLSHA
jgi:AcrR family transcriptional regulator